MALHAVEVAPLVVALLNSIILVYLHNKTRGLPSCITTIDDYRGSIMAPKERRMEDFVVIRRRGL